MPFSVEMPKVAASPVFGATAPIRMSFAAAATGASFFPHPETPSANVAAAISPSALFIVRSFNL
jgi:hypothetical protein